MAYSDIYDAAQPGSVTYKQTAVAMSRAAAAAADTAGGGAGAARNRKWGKKVTRTPQLLHAEVDRWIWTVLEDTTLASQAPATQDATVQTRVDALVDTFATGR